MTRINKIQHLFISELLKEGHVAITLPDGFRLEVGITQENKHGDLELTDDYCWVIASQEDRSVSMDSYNQGLRFASSRNQIVCEQDVENGEGSLTRVLEVV